MKTRESLTGLSLIAMYVLASSVGASENDLRLDDMDLCHGLRADMEDVPVVRLPKPAPGETWILVTSAFHMPRAVGVFRQTDWEVTAYPVDYKTTGWTAAYTFSLNARSNLDKLELALKEWVGLAAYYVLGRTPELFPAPVR